VAVRGGAPGDPELELLKPENFGKIIIKTNSRHSPEITIYESGEVAASVR
jgi:hypothetical protein